jgi:hypothetical protein
MILNRRRWESVANLQLPSYLADIICLSESWLKSNITNEIVDIVCYMFYRKDRLDYRSGGVKMYVSDSLPHRKAPKFMLDEIELLWVEINLGVK